MQFSHNTPRKIRTLLTRGRVQRSKREAPQQAGTSEADMGVVMSPTGREAMGPWAGAFEEASSMPPSPTVFTDGFGIVFADLAGSPVASFTEAQAPVGSDTKDVIEFDEGESRRERRRARRSAGGKMQQARGHGWLDLNAPHGHAAPPMRKTRNIMQPTRGQT